jgi:DNA-binding MarR family transcriptional regulator
MATGTDGGAAIQLAGMTTPAPLLAVRAVVAIYREFEQVTRRSDISLAQYRLMLYLRTGPKRAGEVAAAVAVAKPTVSLALNALRDKGWITSSADEADGRVSRILMTKAGKARMESFEAELAASIAPMLGGADAKSLCDALAASYVAMGATREARLKGVEDSLREPALDRAAEKSFIR